MPFGTFNFLYVTRKKVVRKVKLIVLAFKYACERKNLN